jgi:hypothetical protein
LSHSAFAALSRCICIQLNRGVLEKSSLLDFGAKVGLGWSLANTPLQAASIFPAANLLVEKNCAD